MWDQFDDPNGRGECYDWPGLVDCYDPGGACALRSWNARRRRSLQAVGLGECNGRSQQQRIGEAVAATVIGGFILKALMG